MFDIGANEIMELDDFECITHIMTENGYVSDVPVKIRVFRKQTPNPDISVDNIRDRD